MTDVWSTSVSGQEANANATWPEADLERRVLHTLDLASAVVADFGKTGYADEVRPVLGFGPEKVVAEAAMLAYAVHGASASDVLRDRVGRLARQLDPLVRSERALLDMVLHPEQVFRRVVPHVLLTAMGHPHDAFDEVAAAQTARVLSHAMDQPPTVMAERRWITSLWDRDLPPVPDTTAGTVLTHPFDLLTTSREDPYGLTHLLFYVTDFGRHPDPPLGRPRADLLADVEALVVRYLEQGDYDLVGELLMAWPQLRADWTPTATFAFRVLAHVEDVVGLLPCGNLDLDRLASLEGAERTRYARAASYHTAMVMGFLCATALRGGPPPLRITGPPYDAGTVAELRASVAGETSDWSTVLDLCDVREFASLVPMIADIGLTRAMRQLGHGSINNLLTAARATQISGSRLCNLVVDLCARLVATR